jgi:hypothetical protein
MNTTNDAVEQVVADALAAAVPAATERRVRLPRLPGKVDAVIGMRRSGKTWLLHREMAALLDAGTPRERVVFVSFEDERLLPMEAAELGRIPAALHRLRPDTASGPINWFFDEVHNVAGWERFVRRLVDAGHAVAVTGSSAKLLGREIATSLRGRGLASELLPFAFDEALVHQGIEVPARLPGPAAQRALLSNRLRAWLDAGGFPEVQRLGADLRVRLLQEYVDVALFRDVVERHGVTHTAALRWLVRRLVANPGCLFSVHRAHADLRSQGLGMAKDALYALVEHVEDAYLALLVPRLDDLARARSVHPRKVYLVDHGLAAAFSYRSDVGHRLENAVHAELRRRKYTIAYAVTPDGREVDFVAERGGERHVVQVCSDAADKETRQRELGATDAAMEWLGLDEAEIVTLDEEGSQRTGHGRVRLVPAWRWMLERR